MDLKNKIFKNLVKLSKYYPNIPAGEMIVRILSEQKANCNLYYIDDESFLELIEKELKIVKKNKNLQF